MPDAALPQLVLSPTNSPSKSTVVEPDKIICPICEDLVDEELLQTFSKGLKMDVARQAKFCRLHKKKSAEQIWEAKGYPNIEWSELKGRIERHHDHIKSLIAGKASETHFGSLLMEKIKSGQNRTLLKTDDYLSPGYYGLRGMSLMTETIVEMFSALLRKRAPQDKLISARGYSGFVQAVLVPELAVMLIQEDMSLSAEKARGVMQDSRAVGE
ncbi:RTC4-like domain-domain-containing protein, partial [Coniella lustricola]